MSIAVPVMTKTATGFVVRSSYLGMNIQINVWMTEAGVPGKKPGVCGIKKKYPVNRQERIRQRMEQKRQTEERRKIRHRMKKKARHQEREILMKERRKQYRIRRNHQTPGRMDKREHPQKMVNLKRLQRRSIV